MAFIIKTVIVMEGKMKTIRVAAAVICDDMESSRGSGSFPAARSRRERQRKKRWSERSGRNWIRKSKWEH